MRNMIVLSLVLLAFSTLTADDGGVQPQVTLQLPPGEGNPRNSEGDFISLRDGRILFVYTHFTGGGGDHATAHLAGRFSRDGGATWDSADTLILPNEAKMNIMSVSLLRLADGRIAMFYLRKHSVQDCRPVVRFSSDDAKTWSDPVHIIPEDAVGYYVLNNDRVIQHSGGRIIVPLALHSVETSADNDWTGRVLCYLSDDAGKTWRRSETLMEARDPETGKRWIAQEPGVVELRDGRVMMFVRSDAGSQLISHSTDAGNTWSDLRPSSLRSPLSPATIQRIPGTDRLVCIWNDHADIAENLKGKRTPLSMAISTDEGETWQPSVTLFDNPNGWYCYTAMEFTKENILLGHCAGDRTKNNGLAETWVTRVRIPKGVEGR